MRKGTETGGGDVVISVGGVGRFRVWDLHLEE